MLRLDDMHQPTTPDAPVAEHTAKSDFIAFSTGKRRGIGARQGVTYLGGEGGEAELQAEHIKGGDDGAPLEQIRMVAHLQPPPDTPFGVC